MAVASLACALAGDLTALLVARAGQALGGAGGLIAVFAILGGGEGPGRRLWAGAAVFGTAIGPALGGALTEVFSWQAIFVFQAPIAALAAVAVLVGPAAGAPRDPRVAAAVRAGARRSRSRSCRPRSARSSSSSSCCSSRAGACRRRGRRDRERDPARRALGGARVRGDARMRAAVGQRADRRRRPRARLAARTRALRGPSCRRRRPASGWGWR